MDESVYIKFDIPCYNSYNLNYHDLSRTTFDPTMLFESSRWSIVGNYSKLREIMIFTPAQRVI